MHKKVLHLFLLCLGCQSTGEVRPVPYRVPLADAARTQILVLATPHLRELAECYRPAVLDRLRERLRHFRPDLIAIESLPPEAIVAFEQEDSDFAREVLEGFARSITEAARHAQQALGLSRAQAQRLLDQPTPDAGGERPETRVLRLIAAYQLDSAVLVWSGLPEEARRRSGVAPLARHEPQALYERLCRLTGVRQDPCVLDTFSCAGAQARDPGLPAEQRKWWWWSRLRKREHPGSRPVRRIPGTAASTSPPAPSPSGRPAAPPGPGRPRRPPRSPERPGRRRTEPGG